MDRTSELIRQAKEGDKKARSQLVEENMGLIWSVVRRFQGRGCDNEDLFQIGSIGLLKCIDGFDLTRGVKFSTYAIPLIIGEMKRFLRDDGIVKVSRSLKELNYKIKKETERFLENNYREPTINEIAITLQEDEMTILMAMESGQEISSLNQVIFQNEGDEIYLEERLEEKKDDVENMVNQLYLKELLDTLDEQERKLIDMRYFEEKTQAAIAEVLGVSQVQVSRLERRILQKLRNTTEENAHTTKKKKE